MYTGYFVRLVKVYAKFIRTLTFETTVNLELDLNSFDIIYWIWFVVVGTSTSMACHNLDVGWTLCWLNLKIGLSIVPQEVSLFPTAQRNYGPIQITSYLNLKESTRKTVWTNPHGSLYDTQTVGANRRFWWNNVKRVVTLFPCQREHNSIVFYQEVRDSNLHILCHVLTLMITRQWLCNTYSNPTNKLHVWSWHPTCF